MTTNLYCIFSFFFCVLTFSTQAQITNILELPTSIRTDGVNPDPSAILDVQSTNKGVLIPRMTSVQRNSIGGAPPMIPQGLLVFDTDTGSFWYYDTAWKELGTAGGSGMANMIIDTDGDTKLTVEELPDDDNLIFTSSSNELMRIDGSNASFVGGGSGNIASGFESFVGGGQANTASEFDAFVAGGIFNNASGVASFSSGYFNNTSGLYGFTAGGGFNDNAGASSFIGGGEFSIIPDTVFGGLVAGGSSNEAQDDFAAVVGGNTNIAAQVGAFVGGGSENTASGNSAFIAGGSTNVASGDYSFCSGNGNFSTGVSSFIAAGSFNSTSGENSFIGGGETNLISDDLSGFLPRDNSFIGGGENNIINSRNILIGGGQNNVVHSANSGIIGGRNNIAGTTLTILVSNSVVSGGENNTASGSNAFVGGGNGNTVSSDDGFVGGGSSNVASGLETFIGGGRSNNASGFLSFVGGGRQNTAPSYAEAVFGVYATNYTPSSTVSFSSNDRIFTVGNGLSDSNRSNALTILKSGNTGIGRTPTTNVLEVNGDASKSSAGDWLANSDARLKKNIQALDSKEVLQKLLQLQGITYEWNDKVTENERPEGIQYGFTAQNIQKVFPELVSEDADGYLQTAYGTYDAMYIEAIRALADQNQAQQQLINMQQNLLEILQTDVQDLRQQLSSLSANAESSTSK